MVAAKTLLDASTKDPELRAFAYVQSRFVRGARSAVDCLLPFVTFAISKFEGQPFDGRAIIEFLTENYQLSVPYYMLEEMVPRLIQLGALRRRQIGDVITCHNLSEDSQDIEEELDFSLEEIREAEDGLRRFAETMGAKEPYSSETWGEALIAFFQSEASEQKSITKTVEGLLVSDTAFFDNKIVADFVLDAYERNSRHYSVIEKIFYGVLVSEFLVRIETTGNKSDYKGLNVIYDTTVLMRLLGTSGKYLRTATLEMHQVLQDLGCQTYYYSHTYSELLGVLDYIVNAYNSGDHIFIETQHALNDKEVTIAQISSFLASADVFLGQRGITEHPVSYENRTSDSFQIDERMFVQNLTRSGKYRYGAATADYDSKSLALTLRLREGQFTRNVADSRAIFITHNSFLANSARRFLADEGLLPARAIGPILTVGQITTVGWLANEIIYEPQRISKELTANCYRASLPMDGWSSTFWEILKEADPSLAGRLTDNTLLVHSVQEIALQETRGHSGLIKKLDFNEIVEEAEAEVDRARDNALAEGHEQGIQEAREGLKISADRRAVVISAKAATIIEVFLFLLVVTCLALSYFFLDQLEVVSKNLVRLVLFFFAALSALDLLNISLPFSFRRWLGKRLLSLIKRIQGFFSAT